jgi:2,4-dienoyl-CoA reductase-like NADH-dependent reductase (Old Yellow Enzyme family)
VGRQEQFRYLFMPLKLGTITLPNRIAMTCHATGYDNLDALPSKRTVDYLLARARGGAGLLITGPHHVTPVTSAAPFGSIHDDKAIQPLHGIADAFMSMVRKSWRSYAIWVETIPHGSTEG